MASIEIFCCYAREDQPLLEKLKKQLTPLERQGLITIWSDTNINAGEEWEEQIKEHLNTAHIIFLLVSPDFMASEYCYSNEMKRAMERHDLAEAHVIPILLGPTFWKGAPFTKLQLLPTDAKAVTDRGWTEDEAFYDVVENISTVVRELRIKHILIEANNLYKDSHHEEALVIYDQLIDLEPEYAPAYLGKGETLLALARYEESLDAFNKAIQVDPKIADANFYASKAYALRKLQHYEESLAAYDEAIHSNPLNTHLYEEKANALLHLLLYEEALAVYEQVIRLEPEEAYHYQQKGDVLVKLKSYDEALEMYEKAISLKPKHAQYYQKKGELLLNLARYEEAVATYEQVVQISPLPVYYQKKGRALLELKRFDEALAAYEDCIRLGADDPYSYHARGKHCLVSKDTKRPLPLTRRLFALESLILTLSFIMIKVLCMNGLPSKPMRWLGNTDILETGRRN